MKLNKILNDFLSDEHRNISYLEQGLSNNNYMLEFNKEQYVLRLPKEGNELIFDYKQEAEVLKFVDDLDVPLIYFNPSNGIKVTKYISDAQHFKRKYLVQATLLIKKLHEKKISTGINYNIKEEFSKYQNKEVKPLFDTRFAQDIFDKLQQIPGPKILCHNDLVQGNFLFTEQENYLIDYEFAKDNHPYFDLMSFITENDIQNEDDRELIYHTYFDKIIDQKTRKHLKVFERAHHVLWQEWASYMYHYHQEQIYYEIAQLKYKRLLETYEK